MKKIAVVGSSGFVGKALFDISKELDISIISITKENFSKYSSESFDVLIHAAMPSGKYWAKINPFEDFTRTVGLTAELIYNWNYEKFVLISTISAKNYLIGHPYAIHKRLSEILASSKNSLIVRLGTLYGNNMKKGPLYDLLNNKQLFVDLQSQYNFIDVEFCAKWIFNNLDKKGIIELGASDTLSLLDIAKKLQLDPHYTGEVEIISTEKIEKDMPNTNEIWEFLTKYTKLTQ
ncbi:MAG: hypothetical protein KGZ37_08020 [Nitrosarchaeum sp.]|nr:hypothetical protein [Nitrosarchaeum sp.]